jgi:hypothetical protein
MCSVVVLVNRFERRGRSPSLCLRIRREMKESSENKRTSMRMMTEL